MTKSLSYKLYLKKQVYGLRMKEGIAVLEHLNFFNKVISELLAVDVKINEEDKALILLSSLLKSYDHIITIMLYGKETLISNKIRKMPNQEQTGSGLVITKRKGRERRNRPSSSKARHFYTGKVIRRMTASIDKND